MVSGNILRKSFLIYHISYKESVVVNLADHLSLEDYRSAKDFGKLLVSYRIYVLICRIYVNLVNMFGRIVISLMTYLKAIRIVNIYMVTHVCARYKWLYSCKIQSSSYAWFAICIVHIHAAMMHPNILSHVISNTCAVLSLWD